MLYLVWSDATTSLGFPFHISKHFPHRFQVYIYFSTPNFFYSHKPVTNPIYNQKEIKIT